jgi:hypothetical protein
MPKKGGGAKREREYLDLEKKFKKEDILKRLFLMGFKLFILIALIGIPGLLSFNVDSQVISWNTFMGSSGQDSGSAIAVDGSGNVYVTGKSSATWGTPVNPYTGGDDGFVAKFDSNGILQWNTFLGGSGEDWCLSVAVDGSGNVYVAGRSLATWGTPVNAHAGGYADAFAAKLNSSGVLQWNTFMGGDDVYGDLAGGIAVDISGNIYVVGYSDATWGTPINPYAGGDGDGFVVKLNSVGVLQWNTFLGGGGEDYCTAIALDTGGNVFVSGGSWGSWGTPINPYTGFMDAIVVKLNSSGVLQWNTFMGGSDWDDGSDLAMDESGNIYVAGFSGETWGTPVESHAGSSDAFATKLNSSGVRQWNTFMGSSGWDNGPGIAIDTAGNSYITGQSDSTWGTPANPFAGSNDAFAAKLNSSGVRQWNTFMGSSASDVGGGLAMDGNSTVYVVGTSRATWGSPVNPHAGSNEAFIARHIVLLPEPDIKANGSDAPIVITQGDALSVTIEFDAGGLTGEDADWWILMRTDNPPPNKWLYFDLPTKSWLVGRYVTLQRSLFDLSSRKVPKTSGLAPGTYTFYFAVDMAMNGAIDVSQAYYDKVKVTINP